MLVLQSTPRRYHKPPAGWLLAPAALFLVVVFLLLGISLKNPFAMKRIAPIVAQDRRWCRTLVAPDVTEFMERAVPSDRTCPMWATNRAGQVNVRVIWLWQIGTVPQVASVAILPTTLSPNRGFLL